VVTSVANLVGQPPLVARGAAWLSHPRRPARLTTQHRNWGIQLATSDRPAPLPALASVPPSTAVLIPAVNLTRLYRAHIEAGDHRSPERTAFVEAHSHQCRSPGAATSSACAIARALASCRPPEMSARPSRGACVRPCAPRKARR